MNEINQLLKILRTKYTDLSQLELSEKFKLQGQDISDSTISRSESSTLPSYKTLSAYSTFFNIPISVFQKIINNELTTQDIIHEYNPFLISQKSEKKLKELDLNSELITIPYFESISAGVEADLIDDQPIKLIQAAIKKGIYSSKKNLVAVRVNGESMNKVIPNHYIVIIDKGAKPKNNDIIAYQLDGNNYGLKKLLITPSYLLLIPESYNPEFIPKTINIDDIPNREFNIIGKVIGAQSDFDSWFIKR